MTHKHDYSALDAAILKALGNGSRHFRELTTITSLWSCAMELHKADRRKEAPRFIDGRLQALRRAGRISYTPATGWSIKK